MASSPKLRAIPAEAVQDMPAWFEPILAMLNGFLTDTGNALDALLAAPATAGSETPWIPFPPSKLENAWTVFDAPWAAPAYKRYADGRVCTRGLVKSGTIGTAIFTLPDGFRPQDYEIFPVDSNGAYGRSVIENTGRVMATAGNNASFSLAGISFHAAPKRRS